MRPANGWPPRRARKDLLNVKHLAHAAGGRNSASALSWDEVQRLTSGRLGRTMALCPLCSDLRRTAQKRRSEVLAVTLLEPDFASTSAIIARRRATPAPTSRAERSTLP